MKKLGFVMALLAAIAMVVPAVPAFAQEQTGQIVGKVRHEGEAGLPGVTVEAKGPSGTLVATTDEKGDYRFPRLMAGVYKVEAKLQGFQKAEVSGVNVALGERATVNMAMKLSSVTETIVVTGESVQIDLGQSSTATSIGGEQITLLPKGRDFTSVVAQAAGASNEAALGGISIDGASGSENRFVIDGVDTTHPQDGLSGQDFVTDFIEEVQVKSAGYAAEFGGSVGGVVNAVTKSGTNEFSGWVGAYYSNSSLNGDVRPTYGQSYPNYYRTFKKDDDTRIEPGFAIGGPIVRDTLWFYAGYNPTFRQIDRTPPGQTTATQDQTSHFVAANLKGNLGSKFVFKLSANFSPVKQEGALPNLDGSTPVGTDLTLNSEFPTSSYSLYADYVPTSNFYVTGRAGYYFTDTEVVGPFPVGTNRIFFRNGVIPVPTTDPLYRPTGFATVPLASHNGTEFDEWTRQSAGIDANLFASFAGSHAFKAGVQYEKIENSVATGEIGNLFEIRWGLADRFGAGVIGTRGSVHVRRFGTFGDVTNKNLGLYLQDTWSPIPELTLNLGVRTEQERVPNYGHGQDATLPENAFEFDFKDKLAPRLGFSWDVMGKQKLKVYGSYGNYYDIMKLTMSRGSFGGDRWIASLYPLNTTDWPSLPNGCTTATNSISQNPCPALGTPVNLDLRHPTDPRVGVDPDLQPMENREFQFGAEYQLTKNAVVSFRYVNKKLINTIEDIGYLVELPGGSRQEEYITGNPGKGIVAGDPAGPIPAQPEAIRDYQALELSYNRRFADNFSLRASYTYSKLEGNYSGLASSDEITAGTGGGRTDPNVARYFDSLVFGFDSQDRLVEGNLATDRPHAVELQGIYRAPFGTNIGLNASWRSGTPKSTVASYFGVEFFPNGRGDQGRTPSLSQFDLLLAHPFQLGGRVNLEVSINVLNLFDQDAALHFGDNKYFDDVCDVAAGCGDADDYLEYYFGTLGKYNFDQLMTAGHATIDPNYNRADVFQAPRTVRLGLKLSF